MLLRPSLARRAAADPAHLHQARAALLPPLPLYRRLLRVHRKALPIEMRVLGDDYLKAEFRRTRTADNPLHVVGFLSEWKKYLDFHEAQLASSSSATPEAERVRHGQKLDAELFEKLSAEQMGQLYELLQATQDVWSDPATIDKEREAAQQAVRESGKP